MVWKTLCAAALMVCALGDTHSALWGQHGERWAPDGRLPDFSFAGYHRGEAPLPTSTVTHNVRDFGAAGDGTHDDSDAFLQAIASVDRGVILVPAGRYVITKIIEIGKPNLVIHGEGPDKSVLYFPTPLNDIKPNWGATTSGQRTSNYSWSGGFVWIRGDLRPKLLAKVIEPAPRGSYTVTVDDAAGLTVGQELELRLVDRPDNSLANALYSGDPCVSLEKLLGKVHASLVARVTTMDGRVVTLDRPLRFDVEARWEPAIYRFDPTVTESGIEDLRFEFPGTPYKGHFTELGYNAFAISEAVNCWVRNIHIHNADSGGFVSGNFNTIDGVVYTSERVPDKGRKSTGHHGVILGGADNLFTHFDFQTEFIHDMTVSGCAGNVFADGRGVDLSLDHHCHAPYENLFTNIDAGQGTRVWQCGGGADLGAHCAARGTFWNIRTAQPIAPPDEKFGPWSMNFVGVRMTVAPNSGPTGRWYEHTGDEIVAPANLHKAQVERRLGRP